MDKFLNPIKVLKGLKLRPDMTAADFGSGSGGWAIPLAKELEDGKVYALDILEEPLSSLRAKAKLAEISNIETVLADAEKETGIIKESCDLVLMTNLLFQCQDKRKVFEEAKRILKKHGLILVVDWIKDNPLTTRAPQKRSEGSRRSRTSSPRQIEYVSFDEIKELVKELGFKISKEFKAGAYHWGLILIKPRI